LRVDEKLSRLTDALAKRRPASATALEGLRRLVPNLPEDYLAFMRQSSGAEGSIGSGYVLIWPAEEVQELNKEYAVAEFAPGLVLFATDGADTGYAFDTRTVPATIVELPLIGMSLEVAQPRAQGLRDLLEQLAVGH
jgi:hypothetical protein